MDVGYFPVFLCFCVCVFVFVVVVVVVIAVAVVFSSYCIEYRILRRDIHLTFNRHCGFVY